MHGENIPNNMLATLIDFPKNQIEENGVLANQLKSQTGSSNEINTFNNGIDPRLVKMIVQNYGTIIHNYEEQVNFLRQIILDKKEIIQQKDTQIDDLKKELLLLKK